MVQQCYSDSIQINNVVVQDVSMSQSIHAKGKLTSLSRGGRVTDKKN